MEYLLVLLERHHSNMSDPVDHAGDLENRSRSLKVELMKGIGEMHQVYRFEESS